MTDILLHIFFSLLIILIALGIGLLLRRAVVRRLQKTVLDNWLIQTIGILVIIPTLVIAIAASPVIITWNITLVTDFWAHITQGLQGKDVTGAILGFAGNVFLTALIIAVGIGTGRTIMKVVIGRLGEQRIDSNIRMLLGRILYAVILAIMIFWILSLWNFSIGLPVAMLGVLTVALTVAVQDILKDLVAGVYILLERPFHIGDEITTASYTGIVENIELRATKVRLLGGQEVTIPNTMVFTGTVVNNTRFDERRAIINVSMPQEDFQKDETPEQIRKMVQEMKNVLAKPEPSITISHFAGTFGGTTGTTTGYTNQIVTLKLRFWFPTGQISIVNEVMCLLHKQLPNVDLTVEDPA